jgi:hypothetical protein
VDRHKRVFQIFNVLWNAAIQEDITPEGFWNCLPDWAKEYLKEQLSYSEVAKDGDPHFDSKQPTIRYRSFECLEEDDNSCIVVAWDDEATPPLRYLQLTPDFDRYFVFFMPTPAERLGAEKCPGLPKREVSD